MLLALIMAQFYVYGNPTFLTSYIIQHVEVERGAGHGAATNRTPCCSAPLFQYTNAGKTPTPRRFLVTTSSTKPTSLPKPTPSLLDGQKQTPRPVSSSAKQFASTPRFTFSSSSRQSHEIDHHASSSPFVQKRAPPRPAGANEEHIDELGSDPDFMQGVHNSRSAYGLLAFDGIPYDDDASSPPPLRTAKKRPFQQEQIIISSSPPPSPSPSPPTSPHQPRKINASPSPPSTPPPPLHSTSTQHPRFRLPTHSSPPSRSGNERPTFVLPQAPQSPPQTHPSSLFSPQKKGQKFVPGGLAATVREWVVEASQPLYHNRHRREEEWDCKFLVVEARSLESLGNGVQLVRTDEGGGTGERGKNWVLMGQGKRCEQDETLAKGTAIGVRRPIWEVRVREEDWKVAVEWSVIGNTG